MVNKNDDKILLLKKQIEEKREKIGKAQRFTPITNCSIELEGVRTNINVLNKESAEFMLIKLQTYFMAANSLELANTFKIGGYSIQDWITDVKSKLDFINRKDDEANLKAMEAKLDKMLSDEKKVELELTEIENMLK